MSRKEKIKKEIDKPCPHTRDFSRELVSVMQNSQRVEKFACSGVTYNAQYYSNCWKLPKLFKLQRNALNDVNVNVTKVEKIKQMVQG